MRVLELGRELPDGQESALQDVDHPEGVVAERRAHGLRRDLPLLQREDRLLELGHHLALAHEPEIAALGGGGRVLRKLLGELAEVLARLGALDRLRDGGLRLVLRLAAARGRNAHQDVRGVEALRALELRTVLLVIGLGVGVGHRGGESLGRDEHVLDAPTLRPAEERLVPLEVGLGVGV